MVSFRAVVPVWVRVRDGADSVFHDAGDTVHADALAIDVAHLLQHGAIRAQEEPDVTAAGSDIPAAETPAPKRRKTKEA